MDQPKLDLTVNTPMITSAEKAIIDSTFEDELPPNWFKEVMQKILDSWFDPKSFEKNPGLYEKLGVRLFKKYMPTSGDLIYRLVWKKLGANDLVKPNDINSLRKFEYYTRVYESIHLTFLAIGSAVIAAELQANTIEATTFNMLLQIMLNIYPILVQRYNRGRLYSTINKMEIKKK